jgi:hypothetical protein
MAWFMAIVPAAARQEPAASPAAPAPAPADRSDAAAGELKVTVPAYPNASCPVMGKPISSRLWIDTDYGRIWICCKGCNKKIAADLANTYKAAYPRTRKLDNKNCPVSGKPIEGDGVALLLQGHEVRLHSEACIAAARAEAQLVLAKAVEPALVDVANPTCPVNGEPVAKNHFCVIDGRIVRLAKPDCLEGARKDPKGTLARALAGAKKAAGQ